MSEETMLAEMQAALVKQGISDQLLAVGEFEPRGRSGTKLAGGLIGADVGGAAGDVGAAIGVGVGLFAGGLASSHATSLPAMMFVGVSESKVYGMHGRTRRQEPDAMVFTVDREGLTAKVHQRTNVRVLELIHDDSGSRIELEGSRVPVTHSKDVIDVLTKGTA